MHRPMKELPIVEDYGDGFCSRSRCRKWRRRVSPQTILLMTHTLPPEREGDS